MREREDATGMRALKVKEETVNQEVWVAFRREKRQGDEFFLDASRRNIALSTP